MQFSEHKYRKRLMDDTLKLYLESFGAVCVEGAKSCGKTWLSQAASKSAFFLADPANNYQNKAMAGADLDVVFEGERPHLIDEWQDLPLIWDAVKTYVDRAGERGQFILTGSSTPMKKGVLHSGAGRIGIMRLRTMSLFESGDSSGSISISSLFDGSFKPMSTGEVSLKNLAFLTVRGGWPQLIGKSEAVASLFVKGYVDLILQDATYLDGIVRDQSKLRMTLKSLARNESTLARVSNIATDIIEEENDGSRDYNSKISISEKTVSEYISVFDRLFLIENQNAFSPNLKSELRIGKIPKRHFTDPSIALALLNIDSNRLCSNLSVFGYYFEALCERDLSIYAQYLGGQLFHYRDHADREIDAVLELPDGRWGAFEIKLGAMQIDPAAESLLSILDFWNKKGLENGPTFLCVICGMSGVAYRRPDGVYVVPITALRP